MNLFTQPMLRKPFFYVSKLSVVILASLLLSPQTLLAYRASAAVGLGAAQAKSKVLRNVAQSEPEKPAPTLTQVVQQVTVQVVTDRNRGSGTLIGRQGKKYLVLTNQHVVRGGQRIQIRTYDGQNYTGQVMKEGVQGENDLALVQFESEKSYTIPDIATATPKQGLNIVSAGYAAESGQFLVSKGQLQQLPSQPLKEGYRLGYSGKVEQGMSGGPVFVFDTEENPEPFLIGINGRSAFPIVSNYAYADGTSPSAAEVQTMRQVNWGLPRSEERRVGKEC